MRAKTITTIVATLASVLALALPASAAGPKTFHVGPSVSFALSGKGTHGFTFSLAISDNSAFLTLGKSIHQGVQTASYIGFSLHRLPGLDQGRLDLKIGRLGHFRGHLVAKSTKTEKLEDGCTGEPTKVENGYFVGSFVFHGERGYTTVRSSRESGSITRRGATDCPVPTREHGHKGRKAQERAEKAAEENEFRLLAGDPKADVLLQASREQDPSKPKGPTTTTFEVTARDGSVGPFSVYRSAFVFATDRAAGSTFLTPNPSEPQAEATLEPPAPFSGSATFHLEGPKTASWTGDLAVELPGASKLPLTGDKIHAGVCSGGLKCTKTLPGLLGELLEAGGGGLTVGGGGAIVGSFFG